MQANITYLTQARGAKEHKYFATHIDVILVQVCDNKKENWRILTNKEMYTSVKKATEMDALRRSSRISRKERIRNVTISQQIGLEEPIIKETEQNQLTWYGHVQRMAEGRLSKIALKWMPKQKRA